MEPIQPPTLLSTWWVPIQAPTPLRFFIKVLIHSFSTLREAALPRPMLRQVKMLARSLPNRLLSGLPNSMLRKLKKLAASLPKQPMNPVHSLHNLLRLPLESRLRSSGGALSRVSARPPWGGAGHAAGMTGLKAALSAALAGF